MRPAIDFIGIGAARSATSWLSNILRMHPDVCLSDPKEIRYFNERLIPVGAMKGKDNPNFDRDLDWYKAHFAHAGQHQIRGEFTPVYFCDDMAPREIQRHFPDVRLVLSLRNPIDRAYSHYWQHRWWGVHAIPSFEDAVDQGAGYLEMSLYAEQLKRYLDYFPQRQIFVTLFEELIESPVSETERLYAFLGIRSNCDADLAALHTNRSESIRSSRLKNAVRAASQNLSSIGLGGIQRGLRRIGVHRIWHTLMSRPKENPSMAENTRERLRSYFADDVVELENLLGRDLSMWKIENTR